MALSVTGIIQYGATSRYDIPSQTCTVPNEADIVFVSFESPILHSKNIILHIRENLILPC